MPCLSSVQERMNQIARLTEEQNELGRRYSKIMFEMGNEPRDHS